MPDIIEEIDRLHTGLFAPSPFTREASRYDFMHALVNHWPAIRDRLREA